MKKLIVEYPFRFILIMVVCWSVGVIMARFQAEHHNPYMEHYKMEQEGYNYCPYCGEKLREVEE